MGLVRVFEHEPEFVAPLPVRQADEARRGAVTRVLRVERGVWRPPVVRLGVYDLGRLVLDGIAIRRIEVADRAGVELLGARDIIRPWRGDPGHTSIPARSAVRICEPLRRRGGGRQPHPGDTGRPHVRAPLIGHGSGPRKGEFVTFLE